ncbi:MAG: CDP-diacylglycerol--serine O-phosphatidyltransferase [Halobacteriota archaeon]|nr:CDP-diacylglycerol--serine O-phosphatidyltransferase [Halobacteriota archaeon]
MVTLPDLFTVVNALLGLTAVLMVLNGESSGAPILILLAVVVDGMDGFLARNVEDGRLGSDLDSFADLLSFGVAPVVLIYSLAPWSIMIHLFTAFLSAYLVCGILRLARYNVSERTERFVGLPITAGGLCLATYIMAQPLLGISFLFVIVLLGIISVLMISNISYPRVSSPHASVIIASLILAIIATYYFDLFIYRHISLLLFGMFTLYLFSPWIMRERSL